MKATVTPIGYLRSCFTEKFGTPRQPGLVPSAAGTITLVPPFDAPQMVRGLSSYSHIWLIFQFHECTDRPWRPTVRPPRLGGNRRMGVLATRSGFRPNAIGISAVRLAGVHCGQSGVFIAVTGLDLIDGTPILDIKPYLPYSDCIPSAAAPSAPAPGTVAVAFSTAAAIDLSGLEASGYPGLGELLATVLAQDPRPAYDADHRKKTYGMKLFDLNVRWEPTDDGIQVIGITAPGAGERPGSGEDG